jgi:hypothetical protein
LNLTLGLAGFKGNESTSSASSTSNHSRHACQQEGAALLACSFAGALNGDVELTTTAGGMIALKSIDANHFYGQTVIPLEVNKSNHTSYSILLSENH